MTQRELIGRKIRSVRDRRRFSRRDVMKLLQAKGVDIAEYTLGKWEKGITSPPADRLFALSQVLDVDVRYFFGN